jgi:hypothetical protein
MAVVKCKPTSPGRRHVVKVVNPELHKGKPFAPLLEKNSKSGGRNNNGRITTRHIGGGHKQAYRIVDFKRNKDGIPAVVERLEYDPNRSANIALVLYKDGERRYIIAPIKQFTGNRLQAPTGNSLIAHYVANLCKTHQHSGAVFVAQATLHIVFLEEFIINFGATLHLFRKFVYNILLFHMVYCFRVIISFVFFPLFLSQKPR